MTDEQIALLAGGAIVVLIISFFIFIYRFAGWMEGEQESREKTKEDEQNKK